MNSMNKHDYKVIEGKINQLLQQLIDQHPAQSIYLDLITCLMIKARQSGISKRHLQLVVEDALLISETMSQVSKQANHSLKDCHLNHLHTLKDYYG